MHSAHICSCEKFNAPWLAVSGRWPVPVERLPQGSRWLLSRTLVHWAPSGPVILVAGFCSPPGSEKKIACHAHREGSSSPMPFPPAAHLLLFCLVQACRLLEPQPLPKTDKTKQASFEEMCRVNGGIPQDKCRNCYLLPQKHNCIHMKSPLWVCILFIKPKVFDSDDFQDRTSI